MNLPLDRFHINFLAAALTLWLIPMPTRAQVTEGADPAAQVSGLKTELESATEKVKAIINKPVVAYRKTSGMNVGEYSPGWFHEGASKPNFSTVDVRQTQELPYNKHQYVTSDLNPGLVFLARDLEFNAMTKYFYTNRSVPKRRLTEPEMVEINRLYRIIGEYERKIFKLKNPTVAPPLLETVESVDTEAPPVRQPVPKENYLKAAIGIAAVLGVYVLYRLIGAQMKKKFGRR